jgi:hypothetical protein
MPHHNDIQTHTRGYFAEAADERMRQRGLFDACRLGQVGVSKGSLNQQAMTTSVEERAGIGW